MTVLMYNVYKCIGYSLCIWNVYLIASFHQGQAQKGHSLNKVTRSVQAVDNGDFCKWVGKTDAQRGTQSHSQQRRKIMQVSDSSKGDKVHPEELTPVKDRAWNVTQSPYIPVLCANQ